MSEISSLTSSLYTELTNFLKPNSSTQSIATDSKGLQLNDVAKTDDNKEDVEDLVVNEKMRGEKFRSYYDDIQSSNIINKESTPKTKAEASNLLIKSETNNEGVNAYYKGLETSGVLKNVGNTTTAQLSNVVASAVGNGMSVQDACNIKNGITAYSATSNNTQVAVAVEVDV